MLIKPDVCVNIVSRLVTMFTVSNMRHLLESIFYHFVQLQETLENFLFVIKEETNSNRLKNLGN